MDLWHTSITSWMSCSTSTTATPSAATSRSTAPNALGLAARPARRPARRAAAPSGRWPAPGPARPAGPGRSGSSVGPDCRPMPAMPTRVEERRRRPSAGIGGRRGRRRRPARTFSRTVSRPKSSSRWNVRASPRRARLNGASLVTSSPSMRTRPRCGRLEPADDVEQRRLAGAVRADEPGDRARRSAVRSTSSSARWPPKRTLTPRTSSVAVIGGAASSGRRRARARGRASRDLVGGERPRRSPPTRAAAASRLGAPAPTTGSGDLRPRRPAPPTAGDSSAPPGDDAAVDHVAERSATTATTPTTVPASGTGWRRSGASRSRDVADGAVGVAAEGDAHRARAGRRLRFGEHGPDVDGDREAAEDDAGEERTGGACRCRRRRRGAAAAGSAKKVEASAG